MALRRREFLALATVAVAIPCIARSQQPLTKRIGVLWQSEQDDPQTKPRLDAFWEAIARHGWNPKNSPPDYRWGANTAELAAKPAEELIASRPDLLFTATSPPLTALARNTRTIPIVAAFVNGTTFSDVLGIKTFARPGGNVTGFAQTPSSEVYGKVIDLVKELIPGVRRVAVMYNPSAAVGGETAFLAGYFELAAKQNVEFVGLPVQSPAEIVEAVLRVAGESALGLIVNGDAYMGSNRATSLAEVARYRLPVVWAVSPSYIEDGGMIVLASVDPIPHYAGCGDYAGLILNGAKPGDLPIQVTVPQLTVNLRTARALGVAVPEGIVARADRVVD